jgi:Ran GTPase-activating protein (RanGAP) involved in mRNA processing and transport
MAWGGNDGAVDRWVKQLQEDDLKLVSLHILSFRRISTTELGRIFQAIGTNTHLRDLYVSGHSLDATCIDHLSESLALNDTLKTLNLGNTTFGENAQVFGLFCEGLAANEGLVKLDLENKGLLSNKQDPYRVVQLLAECLVKNNTLEEINLARNDLDDQAMDILAPAMTGVFKINLAMNKIGIKGAEIIAKHIIGDPSSKVQELELSDNSLLNGATHLAAALQHNKNLRVLKLVDVVSSPTEMESLSALPPAAMDGDGDVEKKLEEQEEAKKTDETRTQHANALIQALGKALSINKSLTHLWLNNNGIESKALEELTQNLPTSAIVELKLRQNRIDDEGAILLSQVTSLRHLELGENVIGAKGFGALLDTQLHYLGLFNNLAGGFGADPSLLPELQSSQIKRLDIGCNHINHQDLEAMVEILLRNGVPRLTLLEMGGNVEDKEVEQWDATLTRLLAERELEIVWKRKPSQMQENMPPPPV